MDLLTQGRLSLDYSEDTARTVEVIRKENEHGELGSFGFTLLYEKPPIVGYIVPGGSAERAGLKKNDVVIAVNGLSVTGFSHHDVVSIIVTTQTPSIWLQVCGPPTPSKSAIVSSLSSSRPASGSFTSASILVLYLGPVKIPETWSARGLSSKCIKECTRRLLSQRQEFLEVFLEVTLSGMKVLNVSRNVLVRHKREELFYCGVCSNDEEHFAIVTRKRDSKSSQKLVIDPEVGQTVPSDGKSAQANICHVFRVIKSKSVLVLHSGEKKKGGPEVRLKTVSVSSGVAVISAIRGLFTGTGIEDQHSPNAHGLKGSHGNTSHFSIASSGSGGSSDSMYDTASTDKTLLYSKQKKFDVVDLRPAACTQHQSSPIYSTSSGKYYATVDSSSETFVTPAFHPGKSWYSTTSPKDVYHSRSGSWDNRETRESRSRPTSGNFSDKFPAPRKTSFPHDKMAKRVSDESGVSSLSSSRSAIPMELSFPSSFASRSRSPSPTRSLSYSSSSRSRSPSPEKARSPSPPSSSHVRLPLSASKLAMGLALEVSSQNQNGATSTVSHISSIRGHRMHLRRHGSESSIMELQADSGLADGSPEHPSHIEHKQPEQEITIESHQGSNEEAALHPSSRQVQPHVDQHLLSRIHTINADQEGCQYYSPTDGYSLTIPPGAIPEGESISIECGVVPYGPLGPFEYPSGWNPVSPIVWFCPVGKIQFQRPIEIELPHCFDCESSEECKTLDFLKADHTVPKIGEIDAEVFQFRPVDGQKCFTPNNNIGTLRTTDFCFYCIVNKCSVKHTAQTTFCFITIKPFHMYRTPFKIYFCLSYYLPTCIQAVKDQFPQQDYDLIKKRMKFAGGESKPAIKIRFKFQNKLCGGWVITRESAKEIHFHDISFSDWPWDELKLSHDEKLYPPRFTLEVSGLKASHDAVLQVDFKGAQEDLSIDIRLTLPTEAVIGNLPVENGARAHLPCKPSHAALDETTVMGQLLPLLDPLAADWDLFVERLGVPFNERRKIEQDVPQSSHKSSRCLRCAMVWWVRNSVNPTCEKISAVLRGPVVTNRSLAEKVDQFQAERAANS